METMLTTSVDALIQRDAFWWLIGIVFGLLVLALILDAREDQRRAQGMSHKASDKRSSDDDIVFYDPALYAGTSMLMDDSSSSCDFDSGDAGDCGGAD